MSYGSGPEESWEFLIGYPWEEAEEILREEAVSFSVKFTAPPHKESTQSDASVIAVRHGQPLHAQPLIIICASPDWTVT